MGTWGKWHFWVCLALFLVKFTIAWHQLNIIIISYPSQNFTCKDTAMDKCAKNCSEHVFEESIFTNTIQTQWDLVCGQAYLANMAQTMTMLGILVGNALFGFWSDKSGRKLPLVVAVIVQTVSGSVCGFVPWLWAFLVLRFVVATATGGTMVTSFVLIMELVGKKWRCTVATLYQIPFNLGHLTLAGFGYYLRDWRYSQLAISLPSVLLISYCWISPESPRWLVTAGKTEKAIKVLERAAKVNGLPTESINSDVTKFAEQRKAGTHAHGRFVDLFKTRRMCVRTLCISFNWIVCGLCFYGVAQYIGQLGGDLFINIALSGAITIPGTVISTVMLEKMGRKWTLITADLIAGVPMLVIPFVGETSIAKPIMAIIAQFGLFICFPSVYIYSGELYPTVMRNVGVGITSMTARFGSIVAPHIAGLTVYQAVGWLPPVIFGVTPLIGAVLAMFLPETVNARLPDTMEEVEIYEREAKEAKLAQKQKSKEAVNAK